jgi:hypothetical protein
VEVSFLQHEIYQSRVRTMAKEVERRAETITFKLNGAVRSKKEELGV